MPRTHKEAALRQGNYTGKPEQSRGTHHGAKQRRIAELQEKQSFLMLQKTRREDDHPGRLQGWMEARERAILREECSRNWIATLSPCLEQARNGHCQLQQKTALQHLRNLLCQLDLSMSRRILTVLQYIINKSRERVMAPLLADENVWKYDIIAIQEPWRNQFQTTTYHPVKDRFDLVYNKQPNTQVCFFINSQLRGAWTHTHHIPDLDTLHL